MIGNTRPVNFFRYRLQQERWDLIIIRSVLTMFGTRKAWHARG